MNSLAEWARFYHSEGLSVIPIKPRDKMPALATWEEYQTRQSTAAEVDQWWAQNPNYNIGAVHGLSGYSMIDIDHDNGALIEMSERFHHLCNGRIERSGSGEGYHIPMFLDDFPDLGWDSKHNRPKGNKTWRTPLGSINVRTRYCQTVLKPSIHPSGKTYEYLQDGKIGRITDIEPVLKWLNAIAPEDAPIERPTEPRKPQGNGSDFKSYYSDLVSVFQSFGYNGDVRTEPNGEVRIMGNGGLLIDPDKGTWYSFRDETGGDVVDAFGYLTYGTRWNRYDKEQFRTIAGEMKQRAGIGQTRAIVKPDPRPKVIKPRNPYWRTL